MTPALRPWPRDPARRRAYVAEVFHRVAPQYDRLTSLLSWGQDARWKSKLIELLPEGSERARVLDLATGTGAFPLLLRARGHRGTVVGVDLSRAMLGRARRKCAKLAGVHLVQGDLNRLPLAPERFDVILLGYGLRYLDDLAASMTKAYRALRPGGVFLALDFGLPSRGWYRSLCMSYLVLFGSFWGLLLHRKLDTYWHIVESLRAYPGQGALEHALERAGFERIVIAEQLGGISVIARAERPDASERPVSPARGDGREGA